MKWEWIELSCLDSNSIWTDVRIIIIKCEYEPNIILNVNVN